MSRTDTIADVLTCIRNANTAKHEKTDVPFSKISEEILKLLKREGLIQNYKALKVDGREKGLRVYLRYTPQGSRVLTELKRVSKPGLRVYMTADEMPRVLRGLGMAIVSTSQGVLTDKECRQKRVGGEVLCAAW